MTISVLTIIEIQSLCQQSIRSNKSKMVQHKKEMHDLLGFCGRIINHYKRNCILAVEDAFQLFELIYSVKKQKDTGDLVAAVVEKCFKSSFFTVLIKLKSNNVYSEEIFKLLWNNQTYIDDAFLQLIEFIISNTRVEQRDVLQVAKFPHNANHIYLCLLFFNKYEQKYQLNLFRKSLYTEAKFAMTLWQACNSLEPFLECESIESIANTIPVIFEAMFRCPEYSFSLAKSIIYFDKYVYWDTFAHYKYFCTHPKYAQELARAFVILRDIPFTVAQRKANIDIILQYPQYAVDTSSALNLLMTKGLYADYHKLLELNRREALVIAKLVVCLVTKELMDLNIYSAIVDNIHEVAHVYSIVAVLSRWSSMMNADVLNSIFKNSENMQEIAEKLLERPVKDNLNFDIAAFNKMIDDVKAEKRKIILEKENKKLEAAELAPKVNISPLEQIRDCESAYNYLKENIFNKKEKLDKKISIEYIQNAFKQLLQVGLNEKTEHALGQMSSLFYLIDVKYNKDKVNIHNNTRYDTLFGKTNTNAWIEMMKVIRDQTYQLLMVVVENEPNTSKKIELLEGMKIHSVFAQHRTNSFFNRFHETATVKEIDKKIAALRAPVSPAVSR